MSSPGAECLMKEWRNLSTDLHCGALWDGHFCWPVAAIGETLRQPCLQYHSSNNTIGSVLVPNSTVYVSRRCDENGIWKWDNITRIITECLGTDDFTQKWETREIIRYVLFIGSILSFLVLAFALLIFFYFKSIRCDRITIHIHFMVSLVLKNLVLMMVSQPYLLGEEFHYRRVEGICKLVLALNLYTYVSSINWMFVEGHYVNSKLTSNIFQQDFHIKAYCWFSWGLPVLLVGAWGIAFEFVNKHEYIYCWKGYSQSQLIWIVAGPVLAALVGNLAFLVNIMRILFSKLQFNGNSSDVQQYRRAAKSTLILFPLLGITNLMFFFNPGGSGQAYYMMANAIIQPLQGILVSVLNCFLTTDVRAAVVREYNRYMFKQDFSHSRRSNSSKLLQNSKKNRKKSHSSAV